MNDKEIAKFLLESVFPAFGIIDWPERSSDSNDTKIESVKSEKDGEEQ